MAAETKEAKADAIVNNPTEHNAITKDSETRALPRTGTPNSVSDLYDENGELIQRRVYGEDGLPLKDTDYTDHGNPGKHPEVPHDHWWEDGKRID